MNISPKERKRFGNVLISLMEDSQRALVNLRKNKIDDLSLDVEKLASSINEFAREAGYDGIVCDVGSIARK
jgi:hypothetical protein